MKKFALLLSALALMTAATSCECLRCERKNKLKRTQEVAVEGAAYPEREVSAQYLIHPMN